jgi:hypothetical protein
VSPTAGRAPLHVVPDSPGHGVIRIAHQLADAVGASVVDPVAAMALPRTPVHVHVTDRLFGATAEDATRALVALARRHPTTVTLHDVPQAGDGAVFARRARTYAALLQAVDGWVVSSHHEARLVAEHLGLGVGGTVVPLPVLPLARSAAAPAPTVDRRTPTVGVLGWVYPGKGHVEVLRACAGLDVVVRALGRPAAGHDDLVVELGEVAADLGVGWETSGWIADGDLGHALGAVDVPVAAHRHVSASGSVNSWIAAGRRPLVADGAYAAEMAALRPGTLTPVADHDLPRAIRAALADPASTRLDPSVDTAPHLADCAAAYLAFWAGR